MKLGVAVQVHIVKHTLAAKLSNINNDQLTVSMMGISIVCVFLKIN